MKNGKWKMENGKSFPFLSLEVSVKEIRRRMIGAQPVGMREEIVDLVRKDQLLKLYTLLSQCLHQVNRFAEGHIAIIITVN